MPVILGSIFTVCTLSLPATDKYFSPLTESVTSVPSLHTWVNVEGIVIEVRLLLASRAFLFIAFRFVNVADVIPLL
jgi:hypothetical protein